jgi:hypothetical protein
MKTDGVESNETSQIMIFAQKELQAGTATAEGCERKSQRLALAAEGALQ